MSYIYYNPNPDNKSVGDCTVRALTILFNNFSNGLQQQRLDPRQAAFSKGQELLDSGKITQDQYNQILNLANNIRRFMN